SHLMLLHNAELRRRFPLHGPRLKHFSARCCISGTDFLAVWQIPSPIDWQAACGPGNQRAADFTSASTSNFSFGAEDYLPATSLVTQQSSALPALRSLRILPA